MTEPLFSAEFQQQLLRLAAATLMGGILGIDRDLHRKPAGLRVLSMVAMGAAAVTLMSMAYTHRDNARVEAVSVQHDAVLRTVQGILSGIGFLGAGVILRGQNRDEVHGMNTAASIWVVAMIGIGCGMGLWRLTVATFFVAWCILVIGRRLEAAIVRLSGQQTDQFLPHSKEK